ncbi:hypothetical protein F511_01690 [Dorcoceras hygrometricum]|nr:hypothetical protein F511_01690 [Dorcoceras hygrometricum]
MPGERIGFLFCVFRTDLDSCRVQRGSNQIRGVEKCWLEGFTRRFDGYRPSANTQSSPSANTQSSSLAQGEFLATPTTKQSQLLNISE